jgi:hypothetical protein
MSLHLWMTEANLLKILARANNLAYLARGWMTKKKILNNIGSRKERILDSHLVLHTNISSMNIPLLCFHGLVETVSQAKVTKSRIFCTIVVLMRLAHLSPVQYRFIWTHYKEFMHKWVAWCQIKLLELYGNDFRSNYQYLFLWNTL